jgi:hypothetical protein
MSYTPWQGNSNPNPFGTNSGSLSFNYGNGISGPQLTQQVLQSIGGWNYSVFLTLTDGTNQKVASHDPQMEVGDT